MIVDVAAVPDEKEMTWVMTFDQLTKFADLYDLVILHYKENDQHTYYIKTGEGRFYHRVSEVG